MLETSGSICHSEDPNFILNRTKADGFLCLALDPGHVYLLVGEKVLFPLLGALEKWG